MDCICKVVDATISPLVKLVTAHLAYVFKAGDNVKDLTKAAGDLAARKKDVKVQIKSGERRGGTPTNQVSRWLQEAKSIIVDARALERSYDGKARCLCGCPINCWSSYSIGKRAASMLLDARREYDRGVFEQVVAIPPGRYDKLEIENPPTVGRENRYLARAVQYIKDDRVTTVGLWGMGGVGKSHILKSINNTFVHQKLFNIVILVTASRSCSVAKIQSEIAKTLDLPESSDVKTQARTISECLRKDSFLLLLDDLWEELDLDAVGVPTVPSATSDRRHKRKIVVTTREMEVCGRMGVRERNVINVECLDSEDAWLLFRETVGEETIRSNPAIEGLARRVAGKLGGLPLALVTIGKTMYAKEDPNEWRHATDLLKEARYDEVDRGNKEKSLFPNLKFSYDSLRNDALRECLLCCSLWPEDYCIPKNDLIQCLLGLGIIDGFDDVQSAYTRGYELIRSLRSACLLNDDDFGFGVRVHDVIRDMALWIACECGKRKKKWFVKARLWLMEAPRGPEIVWGETERISLMHNKIQVFHFPVTSFPAKLTTLMLQDNWVSPTSLLTSPSFTALTYLDLSRNYFNCFPENICSLTTLRYLNLSFNDISKLPETLRFLTSLNYLLLHNSTVRNIPKGVIRELKALQMLDLHGCQYEVSLTYPPSLFEEFEALNNLKALGINVENVDQLKMLDKLQRTRIRSLYLFHLEQSTLPLLATPIGSPRMQNNLVELEIAKSTNLEEIVFDARSNPHQYCFHNLEELRFNKMPRLNIVLDRLVARDLFPWLCILDFKLCDNLKDLSWIVHLSWLRILVVQSCWELKQLIYSAQDGNNEDGILQSGEAGVRASIPTFPSLKRISLSDLPMLHCLCDPAYVFPSLEQLEVRNCWSLRKLPFRPHTVPKSLKSIRGKKEWWEYIEWEDHSLRSSLEPFFLMQ